MTNQPINTNWIRDINPDPKFIDSLINSLSNAIEDSLEDFCWGIATDYVEYPVNLEGEELDNFEDEFHGKVISPLYDHILRIALDQWTEEKDL